MKTVDVLVIGGGVNGVGIARDLVGRGLSVTLCEKNDLASATSSASTKLIHGGLRYLEYYEFRLVREALIEREVLLRSAPHIIRPLTFIMPHHSKLRPWWLIRMGLFLYDHLGGRKILAGSKGVSFSGTKYGQAIKSSFKRGFSYSDCWVDDARLVVLNAIDAREKGANIYTRTACTGIESLGAEGWQATLEGAHGKTQVRAKFVVNAAGPWVNNVLGLTGAAEKYKIRWVKGSHIIVPRVYQGDHAYILQNEDRRIVFAIPYEKNYTCIGTTDIEYKGDLDKVKITAEETQYLCDAVNKYFRHALKPEDAVWSYSGVRPLLDSGDANASAVTRDYTLNIEEHKGAKILNIYGGKITTFRKLAEHASDQIVAILGKGKKTWTETASLPGGEGSGAHFETFLKTLRREYVWLPEPLAYRYARAYGTRAREFLRGAKRMADLGENLGEGIYEAEIAYLINNEWAMTSEDILWRRSKLGLHICNETEANVERCVQSLLSKKAA